MDLNSKTKKYDSKAIQTLFRTALKNHYTLLESLDRKASIMLTINSIILSVLATAHMITPMGKEHLLDHISKIMFSASAVSIILAIIAILPHSYNKRLLSSSGYSGILYARNFAKYSLSDFTEKFKDMLETGENIYEAMTKDLFFLGRVIRRRQLYIRLSGAAFIIGIALAALANLFHPVH